MDREQRNALGKKIQSVPVLGDVVTKVAVPRVQRLLGFWVMWHAYGSFEKLSAAKLYSTSTIYRQMREFEDLFGVPVAEFWTDRAAAAWGVHDVPNL